MKINTHNANPNFTLVLPGPCQAACEFCFWKREKEEGAFIKSLKRVLIKLPPIVSQISISGGEPTLSPVFEDTMKLIRKAKKRGQIRKVVLTTNGINLMEKDLTGIDHVNISRHALSDIENQEIFKTKNVPSINELKEIISYVNKFGIDVNFNIVLTDEVNISSATYWASFAKELNVNSLTFRNQYGCYKQSKIQLDIIEEGYKPASISECPVCQTIVYFFEGMKFKFHASDYEPTESDKFDSDEVYELILQPTGDLTRDWEAKKIILKRKG